LFDPVTGKLSLETAEVFDPLLQPSRYKGAYGGRGSGNRISSLSWLSAIMWMCFLASRA
jgi:hypothetical protein